MRRKAGVGAIHKQKLEQEKYKDKGTEIQESQFEQMTKQMETFRSNLEEFATNHKNEIKKNAQFRRQFTEMCASIGVDPLASGKGFWSVLGIGEFYYELAVQIVEVCLATNYKTGGLISLDELRDRLIRARGKRKEHQEITNEDLLAAAKKLRIFGNGFAIVPVGRGKHLVHSVPGELSMDHTAVLQQASLSGEAHVSASLLQDKLHWEKDRAEKSLQYMVKMGLAWLDEQDSSETLYWFPSLFNACIDSSS
ncbi:vacuolar-sorting protein SNF8 [Venturia canescens]|uniref:vacuolar-sorting protein SNF8 n=1 Tax=Venturia canescens TaxID=32260 RepID=UPI001C9D217C|nr:vacuolar-sorting protein SNF8 [Venturia canescens]XP_043289225.1 vacuolar-sorting protein SNF8 [Venturia canescens]